MSRIVLGLVVPPEGRELAARLDKLVATALPHAGLEWERRDAPSYEALASLVREGAVDFAWLPPIVYVRLEEAVDPIASILRGPSGTYEAALVVRADSPIDSIDALRGARAGWVDRWSAAGFVVPRVKLTMLGVDPRTAFRTETFYGSHRKALTALLDGACDVAGTHARAGNDGAVTSGAWTEIEGAEVRVLATFGAVPPDVFAVRKTMDGALRAKILDALRRASSNDETKGLVREVFGGDELREVPGSSYDSLKDALAVAATRGLFD